jgi:acyl carrier protein
MTIDIAGRDEIATVTAEYLATELKVSPADISGSNVMRELPGADSIKLLRVVSRLERRWDVEFDDEAIFAANTVDELTTLVQQHLNDERAPR